METTEKIVESYVRYVKGWATIPNIRCDGQHEIDLLAIDPKTNERYQIETSVSGSSGFSKLTAKPFDPEKYKERVEKAGQRRTIQFFVERKFGPAGVRAKLADYGCNPDNVHNVVVTWDWTEDALTQANNAGIALWSFQEIMHEIADTIRDQRSYFTDDTLRTINLFVRALEARDKQEQARLPKLSKRHVVSQSQSSAPFWVYRNWIHNRARLHHAECSYCNDGKGTQNAQNATTGEWRPFENEEDARLFLGSLNYKDSAACGVCM
jgi:hypothetical protein